MLRPATAEGVMSWTFRRGSRGCVTETFVEHVRVSPLMPSTADVVMMAVPAVAEGVKNAIASPEPSVCELAGAIEPRLVEKLTVCAETGAPLRVRCAMTSVGPEPTATVESAVVHDSVSGPDGPKELGGLFELPSQARSATTSVAAASGRRARRGRETAIGYLSGLLRRCRAGPSCTSSHPPITTRRTLRSSSRRH